MIQRFLKVEIAKNIRFLFSKTKPASGKSVFYQKNRLRIIFADSFSYS